MALTEDQRPAAAVSAAPGTSRCQGATSEAADIACAGSVAGDQPPFDVPPLQHLQPLSQPGMVLLPDPVGGAAGRALPRITPAAEALACFADQWPPAVSVLSCEPCTAASELQPLSPARDGPEFVGRRIEVWWDGDSCWYEGYVHSYRTQRKHSGKIKHHSFLIYYDDGDKKWHELADCEKWRLLPEDLAVEAIPEADRQKPSPGA
eukprot:CAMPEP_0115864338 /NCGR_PEP_ID=MMETSP0287-20121206/19150_1 /TAXON_ID=412157 /ORGANISM="Chrysochromulina rotalis, Strain UIO044" /LENGTH=205 /DNA_ID=CAMNT_0003318807 /DNA_START=91 /DNA_END=708 /DNA_ORIENTATION=-